MKVFLFTCLSAALLNYIHGKDCHECDPVRHAAYFNYQRQHFEDFTRSVKAADFFLTPSNPCSDDPPFLLVLVFSKPEEVEARQAIRDTWGSTQEVSGRRVIVRFLLGTPVLNHTETQRELETEEKEHEDLIQRNFNDTYRDLTFKIYAGFQWMTVFCPDIPFVLKADSDTFINLPQLVNSLSKPRRDFTSYWAGELAQIPENPEIFDPSRARYMSPDEYPFRRFPPFTFGAIYVVSGDLVKRLVKESPNQKYLPVEPLFSAQILQKLGVQPQQLASNKQLFVRQKPDLTDCQLLRIIGTHFCSPEELRTLWRFLEDGSCSNVQALKA